MTTENRKFKLESGSIGYDVLFADGNVSVSMIRTLKECRYDQVTKVVQKKTPLSGDEVSFRIFFMEDGKEKTFPWVQCLIMAPSTKEFFDFMKATFPPTVQWIDQRAETTKDESGRKVYDLQHLPFGYAGAGLGRGLQIWLYLIFLGVLVFPLIYYIYVLATGGYRIYTSDQGIEIKKAGSKKWAWNEIDHFEFTNVTVIDNNSYSKSHVMKMITVPKSGRKSSVVMRYDHAAPLMKELVERGLISEELVAKFV